MEINGEMGDISLKKKSVFLGGKKPRFPDKKLSCGEDKVGGPQLIWVCFLLSPRIHLECLDPSCWCSLTCRIGTTSSVNLAQPPQSWLGPDTCMTRD